MQLSPQLQLSARTSPQPHTAFWHRHPFFVCSSMSSLLVGGALYRALCRDDARTTVALHPKKRIQWLGPLHVQSRQPCSAQVPHERATCFLRASRARKIRTPALLADMPAASA